MKRRVRIGLLGMGVVGNEVARRLLDDRDLLSERAGCDLELGPILVRDLAKRRVVDAGRLALTTDPARVVEAGDVDVVVELIGGEEPARSLIERALATGKHVVTANKLVMAKHGRALAEVARGTGASISMEAAVGAGIPLLRLLELDLAANSIHRLAAVINGTTNYVLDRMGEDGSTQEAALAKARELGYAEADASADIDGWDACYKLALLCSIAFSSDLDPLSIPRQGIGEIEPSDLAHAHQLGFAIKLVAKVERQNGSVAAGVAPMLVPLRHPLAGLRDALNGILIDGDLTGRLFISGEGAGGRPTASAILGDVIQLLARPDQGPAMASSRVSRHLAPSVAPSRAYLRLLTADRPGVLAEVAGVLAGEGISIASMHQPAPAASGDAELIFLLHPCEDAALHRAGGLIAELTCVRRVCSALHLLE